MALVFVSGGDNLRIGVPEFEFWLFHLQRPSRLRLRSPPVCTRAGSVFPPLRVGFGYYCASYTGGCGALGLGGNNKQLALKQSEITDRNLPARSFTQISIAAPAAIPEPILPSLIHMEIGRARVTIDSAYPAEKLATLLRELARPMLKVEGKRVYLACGKTDMRKSINGLSAIVESNFKLDPFDGALFVFCNRNRVKILEWDGDGFWLYFKRLEKGHFRWLATGDSATMTVTGEELSILLGGARVELKLRRTEVNERRVG